MSKITHVQERKKVKTKKYLVEREIRVFSRSLRWDYGLEKHRPNDHICLRHSEAQKPFCLRSASRDRKTFLIKSSLHLNCILSLILWSYILFGCSSRVRNQTHVLYFRFSYGPDLVIFVTQLVWSSRMRHFCNSSWLFGGCYIYICIYACVHAIALPTS